MDSFRLDLESVNSNGSASHYRGPFIFEARSRNRSKLSASSSISYQLIELNIWYYFITSDVSQSSPEQNNNRQQSEQTPTHRTRFGEWMEKEEAETFELVPFA